MRDLLRPRLCLCLMLALAGCASVSDFPRKPLLLEETPEGVRRAYALDRSGRADYWQLLNGDGRIVLLMFDQSGDGAADLRVPLDPPDLDKCRHLIIMLDGIPHELVAEAYKRGKFRLFHPPSRLYSCFPSMTWLSFPLVFHTESPFGVEAEYLDRETGRLSDSMRIYAERRNEPWRKLVDYRCGTLVDGLCYVWPWAGFVHEMGAIRDRFETRNKRVFVGYNASSAGLATAQGAKGIQRVLDDVDRFCEEMMARSKGRLTITLLADHGHSLTPAKRIPLKAFLRSRGYEVTDHLERSDDVVVPEFGLCTDAVVYTLDPVGVAQHLLDLDGVDLVVYPTGHSVTVRNRDGTARVSQRKGRYRYEVRKGDPLGLVPIIETLRTQGKVDEDGFIDDRALFEATASHKYPDALYRIWLCWHGAVQNPPDIVVSLDNRHFWGRASFDFFANVASTHGSLNYANTVTFAMTTAGPLPPRLRLVDLKPALERYFPLPRP